MKKIISVILISLILISTFCLSCFSASYFLSQGFSFLPIDDENAVIYKYVGSSEDVIIPEKLMKYNVAAIADDAFLNNDNIKSISFENAAYLQSIGASAFAGCTSLEAVELTDSIKSIGQSAFQGCTSLKSVVFGTAVRNIPEQAFYGCSSLSEVEIPDNIISIGPYAFGNCFNLRKATISYMVADIRSGAFVRDDKLAVFCYENTVAKEYAISNGIPYACLNGQKNMDFDGTGRIDIRDATLMQKYIAQIAYCDPDDLVLAFHLDLNNDGIFNIMDVTTLQKKLAQLED